MSGPFISSKALVEDNVQIGEGASIWHFAQVRKNVVIGRDTIVGSYVFIDANVRVGNKCKIQNGAKIYAPSEIEDGVFIGPNVVFTNDTYPRAINVDESRKSLDDWIPQGVTVKLGASVGAGAMCIAPLVLGNWCLVAAGSVVTKNVPNFALVAGNPARFLKWVGRRGHPLIESADGLFVCPVSGESYLLSKDSELELIV
jgi:acetyltransferase-like isoleucine patch superfamily enzyme